MLSIAKFFIKRKIKKTLVLSEMISKRDRMVSRLKKEILLLKKQLDNLSETNAKLKTENEFYAEETAKKDKIING